MVFGGHDTLSVDQSAFALQADYLAAKAWIDSNINLVNIEVPVSYDITALQAVPVPEPASAGLLAAGVLMLAFRRRRPNPRFDASVLMRRTKAGAE